MSPTSYQAALPRGTGVIIANRRCLSKPFLPIGQSYGLPCRRPNIRLDFGPRPKVNIGAQFIMAWVIFSVLAFLCVGSVAAMVVSRNQAHNALFLVLAFASLGGLFGLLDAPFVAVVQVIIY